VLPGHVLGACRAQDPAADWHNQTDLFGERDEFHGRKQAELRMNPTQQRLDSRDVSGRDIDFGLVMKLELIEFEGIAQLCFEREPLERLSSGFLGEEAEVVLSILLGKIHRHIGVLRQGVFVYAVFRKNGDPDACGRPAFVTGQNQRPAQGRQQAARDDRDLMNLFDFIENDDELVAAEPRDHVARA
jgi:hypothetical protein